ncbi:MAG: galactokinase family protein [Leptospirales bacterium]|jgi:galactokinase
MPQNSASSNPSEARTITAAAPGRICLFGEHQDYLGLPVIAMAVDREFRIEFTPSAATREFTIHTPDLADRPPQGLDIAAPRPRSDDDYCWGVGQTLLEEGFEFPRGGDAVFRSNIPFRAGCSSSSAMSAAWMRLLLEIGEHPRRAEYLNDPERVAYLVYKGEKEIFQGAGGMMDQYSCYLGGLLYVYPAAYPGAPAVANDRAFGVEQLKLDPGGIILIDSGQPKDTQGILASVGDRARAAVASAAEHVADFRLSTITRDRYEAEQAAVPEPARSIVRDHLINRDLCQEGITMLRSGELHPERLGAMLNEEHRILSQTLGIATPLIDEIQQICNSAGALGGKINGSGGGGTLFCYAPDPESQKKVTSVLDERGICYFPVRKSDGARILPG